MKKIFLASALLLCSVLFPPHLAFSGGCAAVEERMPAPLLGDYFTRPTCEASELHYGMCFAKDMKAATRLTRTPKFKDTYRMVVRQALDYLETIQPDPKKVVIADLDETLINNLGYYETYGNNWQPDTWVKWISTPHKRLYHGSLKILLDTAKAKGYTIMFITGRPGTQSLQTFEQVKGVPFDVGYLKPYGAMKIKSLDYKRDIRKVLESYGYEVVLQIGDQHSDFEPPIKPETGEFLLPNVMYSIY